MSTEYLKDQIFINCYPIALLSRVLAKQLETRYHKKKLRSIIINLSSIAAHFPTPTAANYPATKVFDDYFSKGIYFELNGNGVDVLTVRPGFVSTPINYMKVQFLKVITAEACALGILNKATSFETHGGNLHEYHGFIIDIILSKIYSSNFIPRSRTQKHNPILCEL